jgi:hypothetical protein
MGIELRKEMMILGVGIFLNSTLSLVLSKMGVKIYYSVAVILGITILLFPKFF